MSGHSKWSTIRHRKGAQDAKRGKIFTKVIKEITIAARDGGGDAAANPRLRRALDLARSQNVPADNIQRAIKRGTGELEGISYEELTYEGVAGGGVLFVVQSLTDNRNRTAPELRKIFDKHAGQLSTSGSALWAFDERGIIDLAEASVSEERLFELAASAGAEDITQEGDHFRVLTPKEAFDAVSEAIEAAGVEVAEARLGWVPKTVKLMGDDEGRRLLALLEALENHDDVQAVFSEFEPDDSLLHDEP